eukprot:COSAG03_NODE_7481_length_911_cov_1.713054_1_plen_239_part_10
MRQPARRRCRICGARTGIFLSKTLDRSWRHDHGWLERILREEEGAARPSIASHIRRARRLIQTTKRGRARDFVAQRSREFQAVRAPTQRLARRLLARSRRRGVMRAHAWGRGDLPVQGDDHLLHRPTACGQGAPTAAPGAWSMAPRPGTIARVGAASTDSESCVLHVITSPATVKSKTGRVCRNQPGGTKSTQPPNACRQSMFRSPSYLSSSYLTWSPSAAVPIEFVVAAAGRSTTPPS